MGEGGATKNSSESNLLSANEEPDGISFDHLFHQWFEQTWNIAKSIAHHDKLATEATSTAFLHAAQESHHHDEKAFGPRILRVCRQEALKLSEDAEAVRDFDDVEGTWHESDVAFPTLSGSKSPLVGFTDPRSQQEIIWAVSSALGNAQASLADLHIRYGLTARELALELGVGPNDAYDKLSTLKSDVERIVISFFLWKTGRPGCSSLARTVKDQESFDQATSAIVTDHLKDCPACRKRHKKLGTGEPLYSSVPFFVAPLSQKARTISDLASERILIDLDIRSTSATKKEDDTEIFTAIDVGLENPSKKDGPSDSSRGSTKSKETKSTSKDSKPKDEKPADDKPAVANESSSSSPNNSSSLANKPLPDTNGKASINLVDHAAKTAALNPTDIEAAKNVKITTNTKPSTPRPSSALDAASKTTALDPSDIEVAKNVSIKANSTQANTPSVNLSTTNGDALSDVLANRFPVSNKPPRITERFEAFSAPESSFAQDAPVRYSSRAPRTPAPEPARRSPSSKVLIVVAITATLLVALVLVLLRDDDQSSVSASGDVAVLAPTTASATTQRQVAPATTDETVEPVSPSPTRPPRRPTTTATPTTAAPTTTIAPTTTVAPTTVPQLVAVPDVVGQISQAASARLMAAGFKVRVRQVATADPALAGTVRASKPAAGTLAKTNATVTIQVLKLR